MASNDFLFYKIEDKVGNGSFGTNLLKAFAAGYDGALIRAR